MTNNVPIPVSHLGKWLPPHLWPTSPPSKLSDAVAQIPRLIVARGASCAAVKDVVIMLASVEPTGMVGKWRVGTHLFATDEEACAVHARILTLHERERRAVPALPAQPAQPSLDSTAVPQTTPTRANVFAGIADLRRRSKEQVTRW